MEDNKKPADVNAPTEDAMKGYDPTARDFQRTEEDIDNISESEKEEANKNTAKANTEPNKSNIN